MEFSSLFPSVLKKIRRQIIRTGRMRAGYIVVHRRRRVVRRRKQSVISKKAHAMHKEAARVLVIDRLAYYMEVYKSLGIEFKPLSKIFIKNTRTRWGSCSSKGNLNFSYKLATLPAHLSDYIIVHELCHLKEFNHSQAFWDLVAVTMPKYKQYRHELKSEMP